MILLCIARNVSSSCIVQQGDTVGQCYELIKNKVLVSRFNIPVALIAYWCSRGNTNPEVYKGQGFNTRSLHLDVKKREKKVE